MERVNYKDLGVISYKNAWDLQESILSENLLLKSDARKNQPDATPADINTHHHLFLCEHPPVYTLGKSGNMENVLLSEQELEEKGIEFFKTNRGGDITFHGLQQLVGYPILDLEKMNTDIGWYLRNVEETVIKTIAEFGLKGERSAGETGVWIEPETKGKERKICAIGVRCSRWITMHGFALNVNTDLNYFNYIVPCGIQNKQVTSVEKELGHPVDMDTLKRIYIQKFEEVFNIEVFS